MKKYTKEINIEEVFSAAGGAYVLGRKLGLGPTTIYKWRRVPPTRCLRVEAITGIPKERLRPDVFVKNPE